MKHEIERHSRQMCANNSNRSVCMKDRGEAIAQAKKAVSLMWSDGWIIRVHENLGWHWEIRNEQIIIQLEGYRPAKNKKSEFYTGYFREDGGGISQRFNPDTWPRSKDPNIVAKMIFDHADAQAKAIAAMIEKQRNGLVRK